MSDFDFNTQDIDDDFSSNSAEWSGKDASVFLIDSSPPMFASSEDEESPFVQALRCVHSSVTRDIMSNDQDYYAVILFNTVSHKNPLDFENIYVLQELSRPGAERVIELERILEDNSFVKTKCGSSENSSLHEVLWVCRSILAGSKINLVSKNVLLFTCSDEPKEMNDLKRRQAIKGATDLRESGIDLEILPLSTSFDQNKFYKDLLTLSSEADSGSLSVLADPSERLDQLSDRVRRLRHKQRSSGKITFTLAPGVEMGVKVFTFIRKLYKTSAKLYKVTNEEVFAQRKEFMENGELLMPSDIVKYQEIGGKKIKFTVDEVKSIPKLYDAGIELLGFKPQSSLKAYQYVKPAQFIYCDEFSINGSRSMFSCLLDRCVARKTCPVVRVVSRENSSVSWAYLIPQKEEIDDSGCQEKPPGFFICYLPFADDFRSLEMTNRTRATTEQVDMAKDVMKKLHFKYDVSQFDNPDISTHWRNVETLALSRVYLEPVTDYTVPDYNGMKKKAGHLIDKFKSLVLPPSYDADQVMKKRPAPTATKSDVPKKAARFDAALISVEEAAKQKKVDKLNMDKMKLWLQDQGVKVSGKKKAQLVQDIYDFLDIEV